MGFKTYAIARVLDNPYLERFVRRLRQATGQTIIAKKDDFDRLTAAMKAGGKVATLADQDAGPRGVFVDFFGRPASTHKAVALMAIEFDAVMVVHRRAAGEPRACDAGRSRAAGNGSGRIYAVEVEDVIDPREYADRPDAVKAITAALHRGAGTADPPSPGAILLAPPPLEAPTSGEEGEGRAEGGMSRFKRAITSPTARRRCQRPQSCALSVPAAGDEFADDLTVCRGRPNGALPESQAAAAERR